METNEGIKLQKQTRNLLALLLIVAIVAIVVFAPGWTFGSQEPEWLSQGEMSLKEDEIKSYFLIVPAGQQIIVKVKSYRDLVLVCNDFVSDDGNSGVPETCLLAPGQQSIQIREFNGFEAEVEVELTQIYTSNEPEHSEESSRSETTNEEISFGGFMQLDETEMEYFSGYVTKSYFVIEVAEGSTYEMGLHGFAAGAIFDADGYILQDFQETDFYYVLDEGKYFLALTERDPELWVSFDSTYQVWDSSEEHTVQAGSTHELSVSVTETTYFVVLSAMDVGIEVFDAHEVLILQIDAVYMGNEESFTLEPGDYTLKVSEWNAREMTFTIKSRVTRAE